MIVRYFEKDDLELFKEMCKAFYSGGATAREYDETLTIKTFERVMDHHENLWGVILIDNDVQVPVGYALISSYWCNEDGGDVIILDELYINPINRNKGYATAFLNWLEEEFSDKAVAITLQVLTTNEVARKLYDKIGFMSEGFEQMIKELKHNNKNIPK